MIKKTFKIPDMSCTNCAMKIESLEDDLDGVKEINASYHKLEMVIEYVRNQAEHHRTKTFQDEFRELCRRHEIEIDERYVWD